MDYAKLALMAGNGEAEAITELWKGLKGFTFKIVSKYAGVYGADIEDLMQEAFLSLNTAVENFDSRTGDFLNLYGFILKRDTARYVKALCMIPEGLEIKVWKVEKFEADYQKAKGHKPTKKETCRALKTSERELERIKAASRTINIKSLDAPIPGEDDIALGDTIPGEMDEAESIEHHIDHKTMTEHLWAEIDREGVHDLFTAIYFNGETIPGYCRRTGQPEGKTRRARDKAFRNIRKSETAKEHLLPYYHDYLAGLYQRGGLAHFRYTGMSEPEEIVIRGLLKG